MTNTEDAVKRVEGFLSAVDERSPQADCAMVYHYAGSGFDAVQLGDLRTLLSGLEAKNSEIERLKNALIGRITTEMHHAAQSAVLEASESDGMFEDEPFNIVNAIIKTWGFDRT